MEAIQDVSDKYLLHESYLQGGSELYRREMTLAVSFFNGENQYAQDNIDTSQRNHLYRIEIEDIILHGQVPLCKDLAHRLAFRYDWTEIIVRCQTKVHNCKYSYLLCSFETSVST